MPTILDSVFDDIFDPVLIDSGTEALLQIIRAEIHTSKESGGVSLHIIFRAVAPEYSKSDPIHRYFGLPTEAETLALQADDGSELATKANRKGLTRRQFEDAFKVPRGQHNMEEPESNDYVGLEGYAMIVIEQQDGQVDRNITKSFVQKG